MKSGNAVEYTIELSEEAYDDLVNIQNYTYTQFGEKQWQKYSALIDKALCCFAGAHFCRSQSQ